MNTPLDTRLLKLTDNLIAKGVAPTEAAKIAERIILESDHKPWATPAEAAELLGLNEETVTKSLRGSAFRGSKKICGRWFIPRAALTPEGAR